MDSTLETRRAIAHLMRRAGFGRDASSQKRFADATYEEAVEMLLLELDQEPLPDPPGFDPFVPGAIQQLWLERMVTGRSAPLAEKLTLFWHGHFATSNAKVQDAQLMWTQYRTLRKAGSGSLRDLVLAISKDVAMVRWLDGNSNRKGHPNENYGRELQELFTLGIGNYTESDVREVARAFTGWGSRHHAFVFSDAHHDHGAKTIHGTTGDLGGEQVVALLTKLPACHRFIAAKLLRFFSHPDPSTAEVAEVAAVLAKTGNVRKALEAIFLAPAFRQPSRYRALVKSPVEFVVGALRASGFRTVPTWVHGSLDRMGQIVFRPPSVKGWTSGTGWLSSAGTVERLRVAQRIAAEATTDAVSDAAELALESDPSPELAALLKTATSRRRLAMILGSPEFQLA